MVMTFTTLGENDNYTQILVGKQCLSREIISVIKLKFIFIPIYNVNVKHKKYNYLRGKIFPLYYIYQSRV
jgi:hypothetical protein